MSVELISSQELLSKAKILYQFVDLFSDYENTPRNYDWIEDLTMVEVHILAEIEEHPGITSKELSEKTRRSKGFISTIITKLTRSGYIVKIADKEDAKKKLLFVTSHGKSLCLAHAQFDEKTLLKTYNYLLRDCTSEEIGCFYKVMQVYNNIMIAAEKKRKQRKMQEGLKGETSEK